jgi:hypothetical protein
LRWARLHGHWQNWATRLLKSSPANKKLRKQENGF